MLVRLAEEEHQKLVDKAEKVGLSVPAFLRELALRQRVKSPAIDRVAARELWKQIHRIGLNVNQLARLAHEGMPVELGDVEKEVRELRQLLLSQIREARTASSTTRKGEQSKETE